MSYGERHVINGVPLLLESSNGGEYLSISYVADRDLNKGGFENCINIQEGDKRYFFRDEEYKDVMKNKTYKEALETYYQDNKSTIDEIDRRVNVVKSIEDYRDKNGKFWKSKLYDVFSDGRDTNEHLRQFRNKYLDVLKKDIKNNSSFKEIYSVLEKVDSNLKKENTQIVQNLGLIMPTPIFVEKDEAQISIIKNILKVESLDNVVCGDTWVSIDSADEKYSEHGIFVHIEFKELGVAEYSDEIFCVSGYKNYPSEDGEYMESDYDKAVFDFEISKKDIKTINAIMVNKNDDNIKTDADLKITDEAHKVKSSNVRRNR